MYYLPRLPLWQKFYDAIEGKEAIVKYPEELAGEEAICKHMHPWAYDDPPWQPGDEEKALAAQEAANKENVVQPTGLQT